MSAQSDGDALVLVDRVCPWVFNDIEEHLHRAKAGEVVRLVASVGEQASDVARIIKDAGHILVGVKRGESTVELRVRKVAQGGSEGPKECCPGGNCR